MRRLILVLLLMPLLLGQAYNVPFNPPAAGGGGQSYTDDFSTDPLASRWAEMSGSTFTYNSGPETLSASSANGDNAWYTSEMGTTDHCVCADILEAGAAGHGNGVVLRHPGVVGSVGTPAYYFRADLHNSNYFWIYEVVDNGTDSTATNTTYYVSVGTQSDGVRICAYVYGTGATTYFKMWLYDTPSGQVCSGTCDYGWQGEGCTANFTKANAVSSTWYDNTDTQKYAGVGDRTNYAFSWDNWAAEDQ